MDSNKLIKEIEITDKIFDQEEDDLINAKNKNLLNYNSEKEFIKESSSSPINIKLKESILKKKFKLHLITTFFILIFFGAIIFTIVYIFYYNFSEANFKIIKPKWDIMDLNERKYENYLFDNGLEILLVQDPSIDRDGGSIIIEKGWMDNPYDEGVAYMAGFLIDCIYFGTYDTNKTDEKHMNLKDLWDYYGHYYVYVEEYFTHYNFDILSNGFLKFAYFYSQILNNLSREKINASFYEYYDEIRETIIEEDYKSNKGKIFTKENHILEYLVYGLKNKEGDDIIPEGNNISISKYDPKDLEKRVEDYIVELIDPKNIKICFYSRYKLLITSKYIKKFFNYLTTKKPTKKESYSSKKNENKQEKFKLENFTSSQIIYFKGDYENVKFIDILYYIDKKENETYYELIYKSHYLNYIKDIISETKVGSLYYLLTNISNYNIKSIIAEYDFVNKSKIEFIIFIELNSLKNLNDIIFITYQFMNKIIKEAIGNNMQMDRYFELKNKFYQETKFQDNNEETFDLIQNSARKLFLNKYKEKYFFYKDYIPWTENDTEEKIKNDSFYYFNQIRPNNSVIIVSFSKEELDIYTCNNNTPFFNYCESFRNEDFKKTIYYDIEYINKEFDYNVSEYEEMFENEYNPNILFSNNEFISIHNESSPNKKNEEGKIEPLDNKTSFYKFYFKRDTTFKIPKVFISLHLYHPYLRPMNFNATEQDCFYFKIIEMFTAIKGKINDELSDALRAGNEIEFGQNENYLYINIFCYEDMAYKIMEKIRNIIFHTDWESTDFKSNNEIYKNEAFQDLFFYNDILDFSKYSFYSTLKNNLYNKYQFWPEDFEINYYQNCINNSFDEIEFNYLNSFIINGYIYGYYTKKQAQKISDLFEVELNIDYFAIILNNINNQKIKDNSPENFVNWVNEINELKENQKNPYNFYGFYELGVSYLKFNESMVDVYLFASILQNYIKGIGVLEINVFKYKDIYFEFIFYSKNFNYKRENSLNKIWTLLLSGINKEYNTDVDNIGNKYYYLKKNFRLNLLHLQKSLVQKAKDEFQNYLYKETIITPKDLLKMYDDKYKNKKFDKKELNNLINNYSNILERNRIDIYLY